MGLWRSCGTGTPRTGLSDRSVPPCDLFGHDAETAVGLPIERFYPTATRERGVPSRLLDQAHIVGESAREGRCVRADSSEFYAETRYGPLESDSGDFRGYGVAVRDMTDRRRQRRRTERFVEGSDSIRLARGRQREVAPFVAVGPHSGAGDTLALALLDWSS